MSDQVLLTKQVRDAFIRFTRKLRKRFPEIFGGRIIALKVHDDKQEEVLMAGETTAGGLVIAAEQLVALMSTAIYVSCKISGKFTEPEKCAEQAWDLYDSVFAEADERYKETGDETGSEGNTGTDSLGR